MKERCIFCHKGMDYSKDRFINLASPVKNGKIKVAHYNCYIREHGSK